MKHKWLVTECTADYLPGMSFEPPPILSKRLAELESEGWEIFSILPGRVMYDYTIIARKQSAEESVTTEDDLRNSDLGLTEEQIQYALKMGHSVDHIRWAQFH